MTPMPSRSDVSASHTGLSILPARYPAVPSAHSIVPCAPPRGAAFRPLLGGSESGGATLGSNDGAWGGGGGGAILIASSVSIGLGTNSGTVAIQANGGAGGTVPADCGMRKSDCGLRERSPAVRKFDRSRIRRFVPIAEGGCRMAGSMASARQCCACCQLDPDSTDSPGLYALN
jgi:hypothetical protein